MEIGQDTNSHIEIMSGLQANDIIVMRSSSSDLSDGQTANLSGLAET